MTKYKSDAQSGGQDGQDGQYGQYEHDGQYGYGGPYPYEEQLENYAASEDPSATAYDYEAQPLEGLPRGGYGCPRRQRTARRRTTALNVGAAAT